MYTPTMATVAADAADAADTDATTDVWSAYPLTQSWHTLTDVTATFSWRWNCLGLNAEALAVAAATLHLAPEAVVRAATAALPMPRNEITTPLLSIKERLNRLAYADAHGLNILDRYYNAEDAVTLHGVACGAVDGASVTISLAEDHTLFTYQSHAVINMILRECVATSAPFFVPHHSGDVQSVINMNRFDRVDSRPFLATGGVCCVGTGKGKTIIGLALVSATLDAQRSWSSGYETRGGTLILVPPTVVKQWKEEVGAWLPSTVNVHFMWGAAKQKVSVHEADIVLSTFDTFCKRIQRHGSMEWWRVVFDEGPVMSTHAANVARTRLMALRRWVLTATPVHNSALCHLSKLFDLLNVVPLSDTITADSTAVGGLHHNRVSAVNYTSALNIFEANARTRSQRQDVNRERALQCVPMLGLFNALVCSMNTDGSSVDAIRTTHVDVPISLPETYMSMLHDVRRDIPFENVRLLAVLRAALSIQMTREEIDNLVRAILPDYQRYTEWVDRRGDNNNNVQLTELTYAAFAAECGEFAASKMHEAHSDGTACSVCMCDLETPTTPAVRDGATELFCGHIFCKECIMSWLRFRSSCPMCRRRITRCVSVPHMREEEEAPPSPPTPPPAVEEVSEQRQPTARLQAVIADIMDAVEQDGSAIAFTEVPMIGSFLRDQLTLLGISSTILTNGVSVLNRDRIKCAFENGQFSVLIVATSAVKMYVGLNLTRACRVFFCEPPFSRANHSQAIGRVVRTGQSRDVTVHMYRVVNTFEDGLPSTQSRPVWRNIRFY